MFLKGLWGLKLFFAHIAKFDYLEIGTDKEHNTIKVNSCTKFARNLINIHDAMNVSSRKKIKLCHSYRVNHLWEELEIWCVHRLAIVAVLCDVLVMVTKAKK